MLSAQETSQREHLFIIDGSNHSPWFSSLLQIGSTCMNGPSFWCSCSKSARYWLRHRQSNPTQAQEKKKQGTDQTESPKHISKRQSSFRSPKKLKPNPQRRGLPAYVRRPGGPDLRRHGPRGGEAGVRTVQAVHGGARRPGRDGAARVPIGGRGREEPLREKRRKKRRGWREGVFLSRCLVFFSRCGGNTLFWENLGKTLRPARRVTSRHPSLCGHWAEPLPCVLAP